MRETKLMSLHSVICVKESSSVHLGLVAGLCSNGVVCQVDNSQLWTPLEVCQTSQIVHCIAFKIQNLKCLHVCVVQARP